MKRILSNYAYLKIFKMPLSLLRGDSLARETLQRERPFFLHSGLSARLKCLVDNSST